MIQLNLLPDVKLDYIKTRRTKRMVTLIATGVAGVSLGLMVLLFVVVNVLQKSHIDNLTSDIQTDSATLQNTPDLNKILTIQNQLKVLPDLHGQKPETSRLFTYLAQLVPNDVKVSQLELDYAATTLAFTGETKNIKDVNKFADALKFTTYQETGTEPVKAFPEVVLTSVSKSEDQTSYQVTAKFDPVIFNNTRKISFNVPKMVTTRSQTEKPSALFEQGEE